MARPSKAQEQDGTVIPEGENKENQELPVEEVAGGEPVKQLNPEHKFHNLLHSLLDNLGEKIEHVNSSYLSNEQIASIKCITDTLVSLHGIIRNP